MFGSSGTSGEKKNSIFGDTSSSVFGSSASGGGLFGCSNPAGTNIFGTGTANSTSSANPSASVFGHVPNTNSLFGANASLPSTSATPSTLAGLPTTSGVGMASIPSTTLGASSLTTPSTTNLLETTSGPNLFGSTQPTQATGGRLFGNNTLGTTPQQQPAATSDSSAPMPSLFGTAAASPAASTAGSLAMPNSLFGSSVPASTAAPTGTGGGLFGTSLAGPSTTPPTATSGSVFSGGLTGSAADGGLFGAAKPSTTSNTGSLFGTSATTPTLQTEAAPTAAAHGAAAVPAPATSEQTLTASSTVTPLSSLFGTAKAAGSDAVASSSLSTPAVTAAPSVGVGSDNIFGSTAQPFGSSAATLEKTEKAVASGTTNTTAAPAPTSLFGTSLGVPSQSKSSGLFSGLSVPPSASADAATASSGLLGGKAAPQPGLPKAAPSSTNGTGGLVGKTLTDKESTETDNKLTTAVKKDAAVAPSSSSSSFLPVFGSATAVNKKETVTDTQKKDEPSSKQASQTSKPDLVTGTLDEYQYERVDALLGHWDQRVKRQVAEFKKCAEAVVALDLDLCASVATLESIEKNQLVIGQKQQEIDLSLDQIESQQVSLSNCLEKIQQVLASDSESVDTKHPLRGRLQAVSTDLDDAESILEQITKDVNKVQESLHPGPLGDIITMLNLHQRTLDVMTDEAQQLRDCFSHIARHESPSAGTL